MRRTTASIIAASTAFGFCLSGCSSGQLNTEQSCDLLHELAIDQSIGDKWGLAYMGAIEQDTQPVVDVMEATIGIYHEVSEQTSNGTLRTALDSEISRFQDFVDLIEGRAFDDPTFGADLEAAAVDLTDQYSDYVDQTCPISGEESGTVEP